MNKIILHIGKYRNFYLTGILIVLLCVFIILVFQSFGEYLFEREFEEKRKKVVIESELK